MSKPISTSSILLMAALFAGSATAQGFDLRNLLGQPATATAVPPPVSGSREWSGESGASGHPLMTSDAIRSAAANFPNCIAGLWPDASRRVVSRDTFEAATSDLTPDLRIMDLLDQQPEFTKSFWDYLDLLVSEARIQRGRELLAQYKPVFDAVENLWRRPPRCRRHLGRRNEITEQWAAIRSVLRSTATLACVGRRQPYFRDEFLSTLEILERRDVAPDALKGSWAGAFGPTQFMPSTFKRFAVDFDGDGRRDVVNSVADVIASTANNLKLDGWVPGQTWGYEVVVPANFNYMLADRSRPMTIADWQKLGIARAGGKPFPRASDRAYLLVPAGVRGPAFLMLQNFRVIMKYNPAEAYALAIGHLADRFRGDGAFAQAWPRDERVLSLAERYELQQLLAQHRFDVGDPDGRLGGKSRLGDHEISGLDRPSRTALPQPRSWTGCAGNSGPHRILWSAFHQPAPTCYDGVGDLRGERMNVRLRTCVLLVLAELACAFTLVAPPSPASAQFFDNFFGAPRGRRPAYSIPFFDQPRARQRSQPRAAQPSQGDFAHAPPPAAKTDREPAPDIKTIVVMGDSMADWLASGLDQTYTDTPDMAIARKNRTYSGLIYNAGRHDPRNSVDWPVAAREMLANEPAKFIVMMIGLSDRDPIRVAAVPPRPAAPAGAKPGQPSAAKPGQPDAKPGQPGPAKPGQPDAGQQADQAKPADTPDNPDAAATDQPSTPAATYEFKTDKWAELYGKRIDDTIAALKSKGAVFWVRLPPLLGTLDRRHAIPQRSVPQPRRKGGYHLHRCLGWLH
jgi:lytic murein transglycosylase